ncbi:hypothetical protein [Chryseobacterium sp. 3008163]|uniref:hypothetical protein n=1 Tax=Chryseobacterium sp. 3008163 TaxID=2478663 RepID=UPI000F0BEB09|nr:hypothetical protein [Chryseobacterium sp. 3008163]AYN00856.1 hypothetical protein EAG08_11515 [Chryseobacterium sp. 3008163]
MSSNEQKINEISNVENISDQEMLELFKIEVLESRLEMAGVTTPSSIEGPIGNDICWWGGE